MLTTRDLATRSSKATHELEEQSHVSTDRAAKRRRTETSQNHAAVVNLPPEQSIPSDTPGGYEEPSTDDINASLRELRTQLQVHTQHDGARSENGTAPAETFSQLDPEMKKAISDIIDHSERFEQYCATDTADDDGSQGSRALVFAKTGSRMKVESLPILDNLVRTSSRASHDYLS